MCPFILFKSFKLKIALQITLFQYLCTNEPKWTLVSKYPDIINKARQRVSKPIILE